jgi:phosphate transport system substrate-binding protein
MTVLYLRQTQAKQHKLKPYHVFAALAAQLPSNGKLVPNPYTTGTKLINHFQMNRLL